jgi:hypothetical protein
MYGPRFESETPEYNAGVVAICTKRSVALTARGTILGILRHLSGDTSRCFSPVMLN